MDLHGWIAVATLLGTIALFITRWIPLEATALSIPVVLALTGTLDDPGDALVGFGNHAVIAIGAVFIVGAGLRESGVATIMARGLDRLGGRGETRSLLVIMVPACLLSAFMSSAATVAVFLPAVAVLSRRRMIPASRLLMPLGFAAVLGGILTLIGTTPNLILGNELRTRTGVGLGMFEFAMVGAPTAALGIAYMATIGRRLLPERSAEERLSDAQLPEELARSYGIDTHLYCLRVVPASKLVGKSIREAEIGGTYQLDVVQVHRPQHLRRRYMNPRPGLVFQVDDRFFVEGEAENAWRLAEECVLEFTMTGPRALERMLGRGVTLAEVTLSPHSHVFGKTLRELRFRNMFGMNVISLWRRGKSVTSELADLELELGDAFLVSGSPVRLRELEKDPDYIVLTDQSRTEDVRRAPLAGLILAAALLPPILGWVPLAVSALGAALLMVGCRCISLTGAQRAVDFRVLFLIIGTIPLGIALEERGVAKVIADTILDVQGVLGEPGLLASLFLLAAILSTFCNNGAAAVILAPVAATAAAAAGIDVSKAFLAVAFGASCVFMLPFGNQCNLMVMGPGGYTPRDFLRVGTGLALVMGTSSVVLLSLL